MGISLAVGRLTLDQVAEVRILHPQPLPHISGSPGQGSQAGGMLQSEVPTASRAVHPDNANQAVPQALAAEIPASEIMTSITTTIDRFHAERCELPGIQSHATPARCTPNCPTA